MFLWTINLRFQIILIVINHGHVMSAMFCWCLLQLYILRRGLSWTEYLHAYKKEHFWQILFSDKGNMLWNNVVLGSIRYVWSRQCSRSCVQRFGNVLAKLWGITWCKETASVISLHIWESLNIDLKENVADLSRMQMADTLGKRKGWINWIRWHFVKENFRKHFV